MEQETKVVYVDAATGEAVEPPAPVPPPMPKMTHFDLTKKWVYVYCVNGRQLAVVDKGHGGYSFWVPDDDDTTKFQQVKTCDENTLAYRDWRNQ